MSYLVERYGFDGVAKNGGKKPHKGRFAYTLRSHHTHIAASRVCHQHRRKKSGMEPGRDEPMLLGLDKEMRKKRNTILKQYLEQAAMTSHGYGDEYLFALAGRNELELSRFAIGGDEGVVGLCSGVTIAVRNEAEVYLFNHLRYSKARVGLSHCSLF